MNVSVVIPVRNEEKYIGRCIEALLHQTEPPEEIIIVNNSSTDRTEEIVKKYPVRLINEHVTGITPTRNRGFNEAKSEIIARVDADSMPPKNWIAKLKKNFEDPEVHAVTGPVTLYDAPLKTTFFSQFFFYSVYFYLHHHVLFGPNMAIRKSTWNEIKDSLCTEDKEAHEDIDISFHMKDPGKHIKYDKQLVSSASARRILHNPQSFFGEYTMRLIHMMKSHNKIPVPHIASYFD